MSVRHFLACCFFNMVAIENVTTPATAAMIARTTSNSMRVIPAGHRDFLANLRYVPLSVGIVILQIVLQHEVTQYLLGDLVKGIENVRSRNAITGETTRLPFLYLKEKIQTINRHDLIFGKVSFIIECRPRCALKRKLHACEIFFQVPQTFYARWDSVPLRIHNENHAVDSAQDQLPRSVVHYLSGHCPELEPDLEPLYYAAIDGKKVEKERPVILRRKEQKLSAILGVHSVVNVPKARSFTTQGAAVINDLKLDLAAHEINKGHAILSLLPYCSVTDRSEPNARVNGLRRKVEYPARDFSFGIQEIASAHNRISIFFPSSSPFGNIS